MFTSFGFLVVTLILIGFTWYLVLRHMYHMEINSARDSLWSIAWPLTMFGSLCFISGGLLVLNPAISSTVTTKLSSIGVLNADFTSELPKVEPFDTTSGYEWKAGENKVVISTLPGDNHQWNVQVPGGKAQKLEGTVFEVPDGTVTLMIWRQQVRPGIASEVRVISPNK